MHGRVWICGGNADAAGCSVNSQDSEPLAKSLGEVFFLKSVGLFCFVLFCFHKDVLEEINLAAERTSG